MLRYSCWAHLGVQLSYCVRSSFISPNMKVSTCYTCVDVWFDTLTHAFEVNMDFDFQLSKVHAKNCSIFLARGTEPEKTELFCFWKGKLLKTTQDNGVGKKNTFFFWVKLLKTTQKKRICWKIYLIFVNLYGTTHKFKFVGNTTQRFNWRIY